jgi:hypothetical protein
VSIDRRTLVSPPRAVAARALRRALAWVVLNWASRAGAIRLSLLALSEYRAIAELAFLSVAKRSSQRPSSWPLLARDRGSEPRRRSEAKAEAGERRAGGRSCPCPADTNHQMSQANDTAERDRSCPQPVARRGGWRRQTHGCSAPRAATLRRESRCPVNGDRRSGDEQSGIGVEGGSRGSLS